MAPTVALVTFSLELAPTFLPRLGHPIGLSFSHILGDSSMSLVLSLMKTITSQQTDPKENTSREQAVIAYTKTNAYAEFTEDQKGTLTKGKFADLAVLSQDIFTIPTEQLPATRSGLTLVDGKIVYEHPPMKTTEK